MIFYVDEDVAKQDWYRNAIEMRGSHVISLPYVDSAGKRVFSLSRILNSSSSSRRILYSKWRFP